MSGLVTDPDTETEMPNHPATSCLLKHAFQSLSKEIKVKLNLAQTFESLKDPQCYFSLLITLHTKKKTSESVDKLVDFLKSLLINFDLHSHLILIFRLIIKRSESPELLLITAR